MVFMKIQRPMQPTYSYSEMDRANCHMDIHITLKPKWITEMNNALNTIQSKVEVQGKLNKKMP